MPQHWICDKCRQPITDPREGVIYVEDHRSAAQAREAEASANDSDYFDEDEEDREQSDKLRVFDSEEIIARLRGPKVEFRALHAGRCEEQGGEYRPYHFFANRADTIDKWNSWLLHLCEKKWMKREDVMRMVIFWYGGHGEKPPYELA